VGGLRRHDFGVILIEDGQGSATHTVTYTNNSDTDYEILSVNQSCKCTAADVSATFLAAHESVDLTVTMTLNVSGKKTSSVRLVLSDDTVITLWLEATGRQKHPLQVTQGLDEDGVVTVCEKQPKQLVFIVECEIDGKPGRLIVDDPPSHLAVTIPPWEQVLKGNEQGDVPARWKSVVTVEQFAPRPDDAAEHTLAFHVMAAPHEPSTVEVQVAPCPTDIGE
jgi:hypothetical protein